MEPVYMSKDGKVFDVETDCIEYEKLLENKSGILRSMVSDLLRQKSNRSSFSATAFVKRDRSLLQSTSDSLEFELHNDSNRIETIESLYSACSDIFNFSQSNDPSADIRQLAYELITLTEASEEAFLSLKLGNSIDKVRRDFSSRCILVGLTKEDYREVMDPYLDIHHDNCLALSSLEYEYFDYIDEDEEDSINNEDTDWLS